MHDICHATGFRFEPPTRLWHVTRTMASQKPKKACLETARMMLRCFQESDCIKGGKTFAECVKDAPRTECQVANHHAGAALKHGVDLAACGDAGVPRSLL